jgi:hypothetical protein
MGSQGVPLEMSCRWSFTAPTAGLVGKNGGAFLEILELRQDRGSYLLGGRRNFIIVILETLFDLTHPVGCDGRGAAVLFGMRHARPLRTRARHACTTGVRPVWVGDYRGVFGFGRTNLYTPVPVYC